MALSIRELNQLSEDLVKTDPFRTWRQRDDQMHFRSLYVKHDPQLEWLRGFYPEKIKRLIRAYDDFRSGADVPFRPLSLDESLALLEAKIRRLSEKLRDTNLEIRGRSLDNLKRNPIGTEYFIDLDSGNNGNDGLTPGAPWLTLNQYMTTTVRSAGDIAWVRGGTDQVLGAYLDADEDGTAMNPIYIIGCQAGSGSGSDDGDPWGDDTDTRPIIDGNNGAYTCIYLAADDYWQIENLDLKNINSASFGLLALSMSKGSIWKNCLFHDQNNSGSAAAIMGSPDRSQAKFEDCQFYDGTTVILFLGQGTSHYKRCSFDGPANYGMYLQGGRAHFEDCEFGQNTAFTTDDFMFREGMAIFRRTIFNDFDPNMCMYLGGEIALEDCFEDATPIVNVHFNAHWKTEKELTVIRAGGGPESAKITPNAQAGGGDFAPASLGPYQDYFPGPLVVWGEAGVEMTITVYVRAINAWAIYPTAAQLYLQADYLSSANSGEEHLRAMAYSDEVLSDGSTWVGFQVTFTPEQDGPVYLDVILKRYEASKGIYVDLTPIVS